ncbi:MAG: FGGY family carbohydrate kinase [Mediterraneibacter gnavus]
MSKYVCGIDIGTTGVKVMIFDMDGTAISSNYSEYPCTFPQTGWVEQDGNMTWQCTCETSKKAIENRKSGSKRNRSNRSFYSEMYRYSN